MSKNRKSTEKFINQAKQVHGYKYEYGRTKYTGDHRPVKVWCNRENHGSFKILPEEHLHGHGCPKCLPKARKSRLTQKDFLKRAQNVHGDRYNYSQVRYANANTKVKIICKEHGAFWQTPGSHINMKSGCPKCKTKGVRLTTADFIKKAKQVHGFKYEYSKVQYVDAKTKIKIRCSEHGVFEQVPNNHLSGAGCPTCAKNRSPMKMDQNSFLRKAQKKHNKKYGYKETKYTNTHTPVKIKCQTHGIFEQTPMEHLKGHGCPKCSDQQ